MFHNYEEILRIESRMNLPVGIVRCDVDNGLPITLSEISKGPINVESGSWLTRFRIWRKWMGGRWELWNCPMIDHERWMRVYDRNPDESLDKFRDTPIGITIKSVESY